MSGSSPPTSARRRATAISHSNAFVIAYELPSPCVRDGCRPRRRSRQSTAGLTRSACGPTERRSGRDGQPEPSLDGDTGAESSSRAALVTADILKWVSSGHQGTVGAAGPTILSTSISLCPTGSAGAARIMAVDTAETVIASAHVAHGDTPGVEPPPELRGTSLAAGPREHDSLGDPLHTVRRSGPRFTGQATVPPVTLDSFVKLGAADARCRQLLRAPLAGLHVSCVSPGFGSAPRRHPGPSGRRS